MSTRVDDILAQWHDERPDLDVSPMAVIGRLSRAAGAVDARLAAMFATHGLDAASFDVLATLLRSGAPHELSPKDLAHWSMVTTSAIAQRLNKLADRGLVTRRPSEQDGRGTVVALTAAGRDLVERTLPHHLATEEQILAGFSAAERAQLASFLERLATSD
ncbi:MAG TPA: MarR family transcriptional regulator [Plantibacter sp.]|uniref:MarR family winged helix-turn-helix transcriptional regulator n=1 Tax=unclassified Plantibacter TaxID=2624265 RepID=UPI002C145571|nr:MarR family transcriptional regulator [Plantibacter sp.]